MKKLATLGLAVVMLMAAVAFRSPTNAQSAGLVSSILNRMERNRRDLKSLRARISMEKYDARINDKDKYEGIVLYVPGAGRTANLRVEWQRPQREILTVSDGEYTLFRPRLKMAYVGNARSNRAKASSMLDFLSMSGQQVKARFEPIQDVYDEQLWGGVNTTHFKLVPRGGASYKYAEVWVDGSGMVVQTKVVERNDDATTVRLLDIEKNMSISPDQFRQELGADVKRVKG